jgi:hypothetical protein
MKLQGCTWLMIFNEGFFLFHSISRWTRRQKDLRTRISFMSMFRSGRTSSRGTKASSISEKSIFEYLVSNRYIAKSRISYLQSRQRHWVVWALITKLCLVCALWISKPLSLEEMRTMQEGWSLGEYLETDPRVFWLSFEKELGLLVFLVFLGQELPP